MKKTLIIIAGIITIVVLVLYSKAFGETLVAKDTSGIYEAQDGEQEVVSGRTRSFKKFSQGKTKRVAMKQRLRVRDTGRCTAGLTQLSIMSLKPSLPSAVRPDLPRSENS